MLNDEKVKKKLMKMIKKLMDDLFKEEQEKPFMDFKLVLEYETKDVELNEKVYLLIINNLSLNASYNASSNASDVVVINLLNNSNLFFIILYSFEGVRFTFCRITAFYTEIMCVEIGQIEYSIEYFLTRNIRL
ncbi:unnamed protein product [Meloidogyne enterolobii]|uniref:Uncharacterized protein n=1 Tax=Meloidogyne enterolobii TaxID=390850 RepID=A0ACB0YIF9_MELEN